MATKKAAPVAATPEGKKSRTLYMSDADWNAITELAERNRRGRTAQIMHLIHRELAEGGADSPSA